MAGKVKTTLALALASSTALLSFAASASADDFNANPASLGAIPDGPAACNSFSGGPLFVSFDTTGIVGPITDVAVSFTFAPVHDFVGDLDVTLLPPTGSPQPGLTVFSRTRAFTAMSQGDGSNVEGTYTFSDTAPDSPSWWDAAQTASPIETIPPGAYRASSPGQAPTGGANTLLTPNFVSAIPNGAWTLSFRDGCQGSTASVTGATLSLTGTSPAINTPIVAPAIPVDEGKAATKCKKKKKKKKKARAAAGCKKKKKKKKK